MKKLAFITICLFFENILCLDTYPTNTVCIVDYNQSHEDAILKISLEDPLKFFPGLAVLQRTQPDIIESIKLNSAPPLGTVTKVLINSNSEVIGFVSFSMVIEESLESLKEVCESNGMQFNEQQFSALPNIKKTTCECEEFAKIESIAVSRNFRGNGYGRLLLANAIDIIKQTWPNTYRIEISVSQHNNAAIKLYESGNFIKSPNQPEHFKLMEVLHYTKQLK